MTVSLFQHLPIHTAEVFTGDGDKRARCTVLCPHSGSTRDLDECKECPFAREITAKEVICVRGSRGRDMTPAAHCDPRADIVPAASRTLVYEIVEQRVACLRADATIDMVVSLMIEREVPCVPIVDANDRLIGIVSKTDVLARRADDDMVDDDDAGAIEPGFHVEPTPTQTVADIMTPCVHALPEDAPVGFAISLMAFEDLSEVPVVDREGRVVGLITARNTMRWIAERLGYALARPSSSRSAAMSSSTLTGLVK